MSEFPFKEARPGQKEAINSILDYFNSGGSVALLDGPVGSGKSAIGYTIAQLVGSAYYITPHKILQDQLTADFGEKGKFIKSAPMIDLKGRNAYECLYYKKQLEDVDPKVQFKLKDLAIKEKYQQLTKSYCDCSKGECKRRGEAKFDYCVGKEPPQKAFCPYYLQLWKAKNSKICLMNYHSFLFQTAIVHQFESRELAILDESHNLEQILMSFIEFRISDRHLVDKGIRFPQKASVQEYLEYFKSIELGLIIVQMIQKAQMELNVVAEEEWTSLQLKYQNLQESDPDNWVVEFNELSSGYSRSIIIKPIFIQEYAQKFVFSAASKFLIMSATLFGKGTFCKNLGIDPKQAKFIRMTSNFPKEHRPIIYRPSGKMSFAHKGTTLPKMTKDVENICNFHKGEKGIIHTHTFEIANYLKEHCSKDVSNRFLYQKDIGLENKAVLLDAHSNSQDSVILAPSFAEGLDLKDDLGRFQIICKVPYPSLGDPQIKARMNADDGWYEWVTGLKLVQMSGRIVRHDMDYGTTYVLDHDFKQYVSRTKHFLPKWFLEAIIYE